MLQSRQYAHRLSNLVLALGLTFTGFAAVTSSVPLAASTVNASGYYIATLAAPTEESRVVARGVAWTCRDDTCVANKAPSRPTRVCRGLAREVGSLTSFTADGEALAPDRLEKCNGE